MTDKQAQLTVELTDSLSAFFTKAHETIEGIGNADEFANASLWLSGSPEYRALPDECVVDLTHHLERKRVEIARRTFVGGFAG